MLINKKNLRKLETPEVEVSVEVSVETSKSSTLMMTSSARRLTKNRFTVTKDVYSYSLLTDVYSRVYLWLTFFFAWLQIPFFFCTVLSESSLFSLLFLIGIWKVDKETDIWNPYPTDLRDYTSYSRFPRLRHHQPSGRIDDKLWPAERSWPRCGQVVSGKVPRGQITSKGLSLRPVTGSSRDNCFLSSSSWRQRLSRKPT